jgi:acetyl esterase
VHRIFEATSVICADLASALNAEAIATDYSLSPEAPPGTALRECQAVFEALSPGRFVIVGGSSAGANMAAALICRIRGESATARLPDGVFMLYPVVDFLDDASFSYRRYARGYGMNDHEMFAYKRAYCPDTAQWGLPLVSPIYGDMAAFPPALVVTTQFDGLRDQGRALAKKIEAAGRPVRYKCLRGTIHGCACREGFANARAEAVEAVRGFFELLLSNLIKS